MIDLKCVCVCEYVYVQYGVSVGIVSDVSNKLSKYINIVL